MAGNILRYFSNLVHLALTGLRTHPPTHPLTHLLNQADAPSDLVHLALTGVQKLQQEQPVILSRCFPSKSTAGYTNMADRQVHTRMHACIHTYGRLAGGERQWAPRPQRSYLLPRNHLLDVITSSASSGGERQWAPSPQRASNVPAG